MFKKITQCHHGGGLGWSLERHFVHPAERDTKACDKGVDRLKNYQDKYIWQDQELNTQGEGGVLMSRLLAWMDMGAFPTKMGTEKREPCK